MHFIGHCQICRRVIGWVSLGESPAIATAISATTISCVSAVAVCADEHAAVRVVGTLVQALTPCFPLEP